MPFEAFIQKAVMNGLGPALPMLVLFALAINLAVFVGRRVPSVLLAYPLALVVGLAMVALGPLIASYLLIAA